jgi:hypothetical protein
MAAVNTFEMSASFYETTRRNIAEDSHLLLCVFNRLQFFSGEG